MGFSFDLTEVAVDDDVSQDLLVVLVWIHFIDCLSEVSKALNLLLTDDYILELIFEINPHFVSGKILPVERVWWGILKSQEVSNDPFYDKVHGVMVLLCNI